MMRRNSVKSATFHGPLLFELGDRLSCVGLRKMCNEEHPLNEVDKLNVEIIFGIKFEMTIVWRIKLARFLLARSAPGLETTFFRV